MKNKIKFSCLNLIYFLSFFSIGSLLYNDFFVKNDTSILTFVFIGILLTINYFILVEKDKLKVIEKL